LRLSFLAEASVLDDELLKLLQDASIATASKQYIVSL